MPDNQQTWNQIKEILEYYTWMLGPTVDAGFDLR